MKQYVVDIPRENGAAFYDHLLRKTCLVEEVMEWCEENGYDYPTVESAVYHPKIGPSFNAKGEPEFSHYFTFTNEDAAMYFKLRWT